MSDLGLHRFEQRKTTIIAMLDHLGDLKVVDEGRKRGNRLLRFEVRAPGHGLADHALFVYSEWYARVPRGWRISRHQYDFVDRRAGGRLGYHWHPVTARRAVHHAHCEERLGAPKVTHYRWYEIDLLEAHDEFVRRYASEQRIDCSGLLPLV